MDPSVIAILEIVKLSDLVFFIFAGVTVLGAAGVAFSENVVYSAFALLAALFGEAALFAWLSADYLAVTQLIVYVGGTLVLFLFAVMLTATIRDVKRSNPVVNPLAGGLVATAMAGVLIFVALSTPWRVVSPVWRTTTAPLGDALLTQYLLPFEALSLVILAALVGAVMVARKEVRD